jgi:hypothetical protein
MNSFFQARTCFPKLFCVDTVFFRQFAVNNTRLTRYKDENLESDAQAMYVEYIKFTSFDSEQAACCFACRRD